MSMTFTCDDKATLVSYLYGEIDVDTRRAVDDHLAACVACASEVTALGDTRAELGLWVPPDVELDFTIVKKSTLAASNVVRPERWWQTVPAWAQAAAAILVLAAGASIANLQIRSGPEGLSVSTGWMRPATQPAPATAPANDGYRVELASLEQKLRDEIRAAREQQPARGVATAASPLDDGTLRRVQQLIAAAEQRHSQELAARFVEFANDMTLQRRADMDKVTRAIYAQESQMFRQRQMINSQGQLINNAIRVSSAPQQ
jgi:anti-sigma factor RsiW